MSDSPNQLAVIIDDTESIDSLVRLQNRGFSVLRSAHVGNLAPYNLALAQAGVPLLSVDHTITGVDTNYFPESIVTQDDIQPVAPLGKLVCRTVCEDGSYLDELHLKGVRDVVAGARIFTNTSYLQANREIAEQTVALTVQDFPKDFTRIALPDGRTVKDPGAAAKVASLGVMQLNDEPRAERPAVIIPNSVDIVTNFVVEALNTEQAIQYHLSGPDMYKYIGGLLPELNRMYAAIRQSCTFGSRLPGTLEVRLIPAVHAGFATTTARRRALDTLLDAYDSVQQELAALHAKRRAFFTSPQAQNAVAKGRFTAEAKRRQASITTELEKAVAEVPELFVERGKPGFVTQYDAAIEGGVYVPAANRERSMSELAAAMQAMKKIARSLRL